MAFNTQEESHSTLLYIGNMVAESTRSGETIKARRPHWSEMGKLLQACASVLGSQKAGNAMMAVLFASFTRIREPGRT